MFFIIHVRKQIPEHVLVFFKKNCQKLKKKKKAFYMCEKIPNEFKEYQKYYVAYEVFKEINKKVSQVMIYTFIDFCQEKLGKTSDKPLKHYIEETSKLCDGFPEDGAQVTQEIAEEIFQNLNIRFQSGIITTEMPKQYFICSVLYSVLGGSENEEREYASLFASLKLSELIRKGKNYYVQNELKQSQLTSSSLKNKMKTEIPITNNERKGTNQLKFSLRTTKPKGKEENHEYDKNKAIQFLSQHNYQVPGSVPDPSHASESIIRDISHAISCLQDGDNKRGYAFLKKARLEWINP